MSFSVWSNLIRLNSKTCQSSVESFFKVSVCSANNPQPSPDPSKSKSHDDQNILGKIQSSERCYEMAYVTRGCVSRIRLWPIIRDETSWLTQVGCGALNGQSACRLLTFAREAIASPCALGQEAVSTERPHNPPHRSEIGEGDEGTRLRFVYLL